MTMTPPEEIPQESWTPQVQSLTKTLETLLGDLNAKGWDIEATIYFLEEPADDPKVRLSGILPSHPVADLQGAYRVGMRVPPDVLGLAIASEGYRHLSAEEMFERKPDMLERLKQAMVEQGLDVADVPDSELRAIVTDHYYERIMPMLAPAGSMPDEMRAETRQVSAILRDGILVTAGQTRGKEDLRISVLAPPEFARAGIPTAMYLFLHDLFPDPETEDPVQVVQDYLAVKEIEKLVGEEES